MGGCFDLSLLVTTAKVPDSMILFYNIPVFEDLWKYEFLFSLGVKIPVNILSAGYEGSRSWYLSTKKKMEEEKSRKNSIEDTLS